MPTSESSTSSSDESEPGSDHAPNGVAGSSRFIARDAPAGSGSEYESDGDPEDDSEIGVYIAPHTRRAYLTHLSSHISTTKNPEKPPEPSFFLPASHWSSAEKEAFFRALNIYSRLRPDLIASAIRSKGVTDVCAYIDALDEALSESIDSARGKGKGKEKPTYTSLARANFPAAYEVSDAWVEREEHIAQATITEERKMLADTVDRSREEEVRSMRRSVRARKRRKVNGEDRDKDRDREGEKARRARFEEWLAQCRVDWEIRDVIDALDGTMLRAMDTLIREDEEARSGVESEGTGLGGDNSRLLEETAQEAAPVPAEDTIPQVDSQGSTTPQLNLHEPIAATFDESLIDPALRDLPPHSESILPPPPPSEFSNDIGLGPEAAFQIPPPSHHTHSQFNPVTPPFPSAPLPAAIPAPPSEPILLGASALAQLGSYPLSAVFPPPHPEPTLLDLSVPVPEPEQSRSVHSSSVDPEGRLSPASRRRVMKRLYMRRKRAEARGDVADMRNVRLKPGRKPKPRPQRKSGDKDSIAVEDEDGGDSQVGGSDAGEDAENADGEKRTRHPHASGKTLPYKMRERLSSLGIDVGWLQQEGLDFFHLSAVNRLMKSYNTLEGAEPGINSQISADTLRLLLAHVVYFTTRLVRLAIVSRDQEMVAKTHTKVWRLASNQVITVSNVEHALSLLGVDVTSKKTHFQRLLDGLLLEEEDEEGSDDDNSVERTEGKGKKKSAGRHSSPESDDDGDDEAEEVEEPSIPGKPDDDASPDVPPDPLSTLSLHRQVFPPFIRLPAFLQPSHTNPSSHSLLTHIPWARTAPDAHDDEDLLALETDEEALDAELEEEDELDERDRAQEASHERALWNKFGDNSAMQTRLGKRKRGAGLGDDDDGEEIEDDEMGSDDLDDDVQYTPDSMRYRKPGGRVKSAVYVEDSD